MERTDMGYDEQQASFLAAMGRGERMVGEGPIRVTDVSSMASVSGRACLTTDQLAFWTSDATAPDFAIRLDNVRSVDAAFDEGNQLSKIDVLHHVDDRLLKSTFFCSLEMGRSLLALTDMDDLDGRNADESRAAVGIDNAERIFRPDATPVAESRIATTAPLHADVSTIIDDGDDVDDDFHRDLEQLASTMEVDERFAEFATSDGQTLKQDLPWSSASTDVDSHGSWGEHSTGHRTSESEGANWWTSESSTGSDDLADNWWDDSSQSSQGQGADDPFGTANLFADMDGDADVIEAEVVEKPARQQQTVAAPGSFEAEEARFSLDDSENDDLFARMDDVDEPQGHRWGRKGKAKKEKVPKEPARSQTPTVDREPTPRTDADSIFDSGFVVDDETSPTSRMAARVGGSPRLAVTVASVLVVLLGTVVLSQLGPFRSDSDVYVQAATTALNDNPLPQTGADAAKEQAADNIIQRNFSLIEIQQNNVMLDRLGVITSLVVSSGLVCIGLATFRVMSARRASREQQQDH